MYPQWASELGFPYINNGSMVLAFTEDELEAICGLRERGEHNGVEGLRVIDARELRELEPNVSPEALGRVACSHGRDLRSVSSGRSALAKTRPAMASNLISQAKLWASSLCRLRPPIPPRPSSPAPPVRHRRARPGRGLHPSHEGRPGDVAEAVHARIVVNAAGVHADEIHDMVGAARVFDNPPSRRIQPHGYRYGRPVRAHDVPGPHESGKGSACLAYGARQYARWSDAAFPKVTKMPRQLPPRAWPQLRPLRKRRTPRSTCEPHYHVRRRARHGRYGRFRNRRSVGCARLFRYRVL